MRYDPYNSPAIDLELLAIQCRNCIKPSAAQPEPIRVWDCQNGRWMAIAKE